MSLSGGNIHSKPYHRHARSGYENRPFRLENGDLLFRPGGHGALLENLNQLDAEIAFIKNIDNVVPEHQQAETWYWKKVLGGALLETQQQLFGWQSYLDQRDDIPEALIEFLEKKVGYRLPAPFFARNKDEQKRYLQGQASPPTARLWSDPY